MAKRLTHLPRAVAESQGYRVLDGVEETLGTLSEQGYLLGLTTGGVEAAAHIKLARVGLNHYFCFGGYGSDSTDRAELTRYAIERAGRILGQRLDPQRIFVVGDTPKDIDAAKGSSGGRHRCRERPLRRGGAPRGGRGLRARVASGAASGPRRGNGELSNDVRLR
jgi:phosphoglycolate phosphatase-like HAD superfamily hydrolase